MIVMGRKPRWKKEVEAPIKRFDLEIPAPDWVFTSQQDKVRPTSELEALMMTAPGEHEAMLSDRCNDDPYTQLENTLGTDLGLTDTEKEVLDATVIAGLSYREAARSLGISSSTVHRIHTSVVERIRDRAALAESERRRGYDCDEPDNGGPEGSEAGEVRSDPDSPT